MKDCSQASGVLVGTKVSVAVGAGVSVNTEVGKGVCVSVGIGVSVAVLVGRGVLLGVGVLGGVLRGFGALTVKSALLLFVSVAPFPFRSAAVVLLKVAVGPLPSKQLAAAPNPTRSMTVAPAGQLVPLVMSVFVLSKTTLPAVALMGIVPTALGVGSGVVPPVPCASWIK